jgi:hypothetical protein
VGGEAAMNRLTSILLGMLLASSAAIAQQPSNMTADEVYHHRFTTASYLQRAGAVCKDDSKRTLDAASGLVSGEEMKAFSKSFPRKTKAWMTEGKDVFNIDVRQGGIRPACEAAMRERQKAEAAGRR